MVVVFSPASYAAAQGRPLRILCFGDSWTDGNTAGLKSAFSKHDVVITGTDYWGSTAEQFANKPDMLPAAVSKSRADYVLLSLGGNDFKNVYYKKREYIPPWTVVKQIEGNIRTVLSELYAAHPNVRVVMYGYDLPGPVDGVAKYFLPEDKFSTSAILRAYEWLGVPFINRCAMMLGTSIQTLSEEFSTQGYHLTYVPLWGSLQQEAAKNQGRTIKGVQLSQPSPSEYMNDPIHANAKGFRILMNNLYNRYFVGELGLVDT